MDTLLLRLLSFPELWWSSLKASFDPDLYSAFRMAACTIFLIPVCSCICALGISVSNPMYGMIACCAFIMSISAAALRPQKS